MTEDNTRSANGVSPLEECERMIEKSLRLPIVKFLREHLAKSGCPVGDNFFKAVNCDEKTSGFYSPGNGIFVCSNKNGDQDEVNQVIMHELIHAFDDCRAANFDATNCAHIACTEIRAYHLSGDCLYKREYSRGFRNIRAHEPECVKRMAMLSLTVDPNCNGSLAKDYVEAMWDLCYNDTQPFDKAP